MLNGPSSTRAAGVPGRKRSIIAGLGSPLLYNSEDERPYCLLKRELTDRYDRLTLSCVQNLNRQHANMATRDPRTEWC